MGPLIFIENGKLEYKSYVFKEFYVIVILCFLHALP